MLKRFCQSSVDNLYVPMTLWHGMHNCEIRQGKKSKWILTIGVIGPTYQFVHLLCNFLPPHLLLKSTLCNIWYSDGHNIFKENSQLIIYIQSVKLRWFWTIFYLSSLSLLDICRVVHHYSP